VSSLDNQPLANQPLKMQPPTKQSPISHQGLHAFLAGLSGVDQVGAEARTAALGTRSIKKESKMWAIDTAISMVDLTTLEGAVVGPHLTSNSLTQETQLLPVPMKLTW
jgi:hypothetical protein